MSLILLTCLYVNVCRQLSSDQTSTESTNYRIYCYTWTYNFLTMVLRSALNMVVSQWQMMCGLHQHLKFLSILHIFCNLKPVKYQFCNKFAFSKGDYEGLHNELQLIDWNDKLLPYSDNIDQMWQNFKCDLEKKVQKGLYLK